MTMALKNKLTTSEKLGKMKKMGKVVIKDLTRLSDGSTFFWISFTPNNHMGFWHFESDVTEDGAVHKLFNYLIENNLLK